MKGAVTVRATSPRRNVLSTAMKARIVKDASAAARLIRAPFAAIRFLISTTTGRFEGAGSRVADPADPESTRTGRSAARCSEIFDMIAAVVLGSGG